MRPSLVARLCTSFLLVTGGLFWLAFTASVKVFENVERFQQQSGSTEAGNLANVIMAGILIATGFVLAISTPSPATGWRRRTAQGAAGLSLLVLIWLHAVLFINFVDLRAPATGERASAFTATYLFHTGPGYTIAAVYVVFLVSILLLAALVVSCAYLLMPERFQRSLGRDAGWPSNEALMVDSSLVTVVSLSVFLVFMVLLAVHRDRHPIESTGFLADNVVGLHYLTAFFLGLFVLSIVGRVYLVNWGTYAPWGARGTRVAMANVARVERILLGIVVFLGLVVLVADPIADPTLLSGSFVFQFTSRMLVVFTFLALIPYGLSVVAGRRLRALLDQGRGPSPLQTPFSSTSTWMVIAHVGGVAILTALFLALAPDAAGAESQGRSGATPLSLLASFVAWSAVVFLVAGARFEVRHGLVGVRLRPGGGVHFMTFCVMALATALMLWGAGNTYVGTYSLASGAVSVENMTIWGADILSRFAAMLVLSATVFLGLSAAARTVGVRRSIVPYVIGVMLSVLVTGLLVFSINVWSIDPQGSVYADFYAGLAFHQYGVTEKVLVGLVLVAFAAWNFFACGRIFTWIAHRNLVERTLRA